MSKKKNKIVSMNVGDKFIFFNPSEISWVEKSLGKPETTIHFNNGEHIKCKCNLDVDEILDVINK